MAAFLTWCIAFLGSSLAAFGPDRAVFEAGVWLMRQHGVAVSREQIIEMANKHPEHADLFTGRGLYADGFVSPIDPMMRRYLDVRRHRQQVAEHLRKLNPQ